MRTGTRSCSTRARANASSLSPAASKPRPSRRVPRAAVACSPQSRSSIFWTRRGPELVDLADEAPTLHLFVVDGASDCEHPHWLDPLFDEWLEAGVAPGPN